MINRVFLYSNEEAKRNGNSLTIGKVLIQSIILTLLFIVLLFICMLISDDFFENPVFFMILITIFIITILVYAIKAKQKTSQQLMAFATDENNNIFCVNKLNNGGKYVIGGIEAGNIVDKVLDNGDSVAGDAVQLAGTIMAVNNLNNSSKMMQNPKTIADIVDNASDMKGALVRQILKVYNYTEDSHKVKISCDYRIIGNGEIKYNKYIKIYKSFNCFNDLMNIILSKKVN